MVMPCSRSRSSPSVSNDKSRASCPRLLEARATGRADLEYRARIVQQPPDQRALAVVHACAVMKRTPAVFNRQRISARFHRASSSQNYPSSCARSMEASEV